MGVSRIALGESLSDDIEANLNVEKCGGKFEWLNNFWVTQKETKLLNNWGFYHYTWIK